MSGWREAREIARQYRRAGYRVEQDGHHKVYDDAGRLVTTFPVTPSSQGGIKAARRECEQIITGRRGPMGMAAADRQEAVTEAQVPVAFRRRPADHRVDRAQRVIELPQADVAAPRATNWSPGRKSKTVRNMARKVAKELEARDEVLDSMNASSCCWTCRADVRFGDMYLYASAPDLLVLLKKLRISSGFIEICAACYGHLGGSFLAESITGDELCCQIDESTDESTLFAIPAIDADQFMAVVMLSQPQVFIRLNEGSR